MVENISIKAIHFELDNNLEKYITKKINKLEKYVPSTSKKSFKAEIILQEEKAQTDNKCKCELLFYLPKETIIIKDSTMNMYAAIDIVEEKMKVSLCRYKELHDGSKKERHLIKRVRDDNSQ